MIYLIEIEPYSAAQGASVLLRYCKANGRGFITQPNDTPANADFEERVADPGNYERFLFGRARTRGESEVGGGDIVLVNADRALDFMLDLAFDGRPIRIYGLPDDSAPWASKVLMFSGLMDQANFRARHVEIRIRDRLSLLRETIQRERFKGTTTDGGKKDAEGSADLKDVLVPELYGAARTITPVPVDIFNHVFRVARRLDGVTAVQDGGVALTATQDHATVAALYGASLSTGQYATHLAKGLVRCASAPRALTVDAFEGASAATRSAARIVQRLLPATVTANAADFNALHAANTAVCGTWTGTGETTILNVAMAFMNTIGASLNVDRTGVIRTKRLQLPTGAGPVIDNEVIIDRGEAMARIAPSDEGEGLPAKSVTVRWGLSNTVFADRDFAGGAHEAFRAFARQQWRQETVTSVQNTTLHPTGPDLVFDSTFTAQADAQAEAQRLLAIYGARRDFFDVEVSSDEFPDLEPGDIVTLAPTRFGMSGGVPALVTGIVPTYSTNVTEVEVWR